MSIEIYSPTIKERINPEFQGIATKFSEYKQKRLSIEKQRDLCLRTLKYKMSVDLGLDKNLDEQRQKLKTAKMIHHRRLADEDFKRQQQEMRIKQLRSLTSSVKERREDLKRNIKNSKIQNFSKNRRMRMTEKQFHDALESKLRQSEQANQTIKQKRARSIKFGQLEGQSNVNKFFRTLNRESLSNYKSQIEEQGEKANQFEEQISYMKKQIEKYDKSIDKKKDKMFNIFSQIEGFTSESSLEQSKCLPLYLRPNPSSTSQSSRPRDLILKGPREILEGSGSKMLA